MKKLFLILGSIILVFIIIHAFFYYFMTPEHLARTIARDMLAGDFRKATLVIDKRITMKIVNEIDKGDLPPGMAAGMVFNYPDAIIDWKIVKRKFMKDEFGYRADYYFLFMTDDGVVKNQFVFYAINKSWKLALAGPLINLNR